MLIIRGVNLFPDPDRGADPRAIARLAPALPARGAPRAGRLDAAQGDRRGQGPMPPTAETRTAAGAELSATRQVADRGHDRGRRGRARRGRPLRSARQTRSSICGRTGSRAGTAMAEAGSPERVIEPEIADLLADLKRRLERRFGDRFVALYLFGSRARGDHEPDSDVDVAVILDQKMPRLVRGQRADHRGHLRSDARDRLLHPALAAREGQPRTIPGPSAPADQPGDPARRASASIEQRPPATRRVRLRGRPGCC